MEEKQYGVSAAPNEGRVRGKLLEVEAGPEGVGAIWKVTVSETEDVGKLPNFARDLVGKVISIYIHPYLKKKFSKFDSIDARISFQGDEKGGDFFLMGDDVHRI